METEVRASLKHILLLNLNKQLVTPSLTVTNRYRGSGSGFAYSKVYF